jgi:hypothetical protein
MQSSQLFQVPLNPGNYCLKAYNISSIIDQPMNRGFKFLEILLVITSDNEVCLSQTLLNG